MKIQWYNRSFLLDRWLVNVLMTWSVVRLSKYCLFAGIATGAVGALTPGGEIPCFVLGMITFVLFNVKLFGAMLTKANEIGADVGSKYALQRKKKENPRGKFLTQETEQQFLNSSDWTAFLPNFFQQTIGTLEGNFYPWESKSSTMWNLKIWSH